MLNPKAAHSYRKLLLEIQIEIHLKKKSLWGTLLPLPLF